MSLTRAMYSAALNGDKLSPKVSTSTNYKHWVSTQDLKRCFGERLETKKMAVKFCPKQNDNRRAIL